MSDRLEAALEALKNRDNEPIQWLLGDALRKQARAGEIPSHFLLDMLQNPKRKPGIDHWNARIRQFRDLLTNPDEAPIKATIDLNANGPDAEEKLINFDAEMVAVAHLSSIGYRNFLIVRPTTNANAPSPDFMADFNGQVAAIEVKNLQPPADRIQTVVSAHWKKIREKNPDRYGLNVILRHNHFGELKAAAKQRLRTILDLLPDVRNYPFQETLEGGVKIRIDILENADLGNAESFLRENLMSGPKGQLIVSWGIGLNFADEANSEEKALFLKSLRIITEATKKFFGESGDPSWRNVIALQWTPPNLFYDRAALARIDNKISEMFQTFGLQLTPVTFNSLAVPLPRNLLSNSFTK